MSDLRTTAANAAKILLGVSTGWGVPIMLFGCNSDKNDGLLTVPLKDDDIYAIREELKPQAENYNVGTDRCSDDKNFINSGDAKNGAALVRNAIARRVLMQAYAGFDALGKTEKGTAAQRKAIMAVADKIKATYPDGATIYSLYDGVQKFNNFTNCKFPALKGTTSSVPTLVDLKLKMTMAELKEIVDRMINDAAGEKPAATQPGRRPDPVIPPPPPAVVAIHGVQAVKNGKPVTRVREDSVFDIVITGVNLPKKGITVVGSGMGIDPSPRLANEGNLVFKAEVGKKDGLTNRLITIYQNGKKLTERNIQLRIVEQGPPPPPPPPPKGRSTGSKV